LNSKFLYVTEYLLFACPFLCGADKARRQFFPIFQQLFFYTPDRFFYRFFPSLSAFVKIIAKGICAFPRLCINTKSICCKECLESIKTKRLTSSLELLMYSLFIFASASLCGFGSFSKTITRKVYQIPAAVYHRK
jgi:hypothetical protein